MFARVAVADQFPGSGIEVGFRVLDRLREGRGRWPIKDADPATRAFGDFDPVQPGAFVLATGADRPDLAGRQRITGDVVVPFAVTFKTLAWVKIPPRTESLGSVILRMATPVTPGIP